MVRKNSRVSQRGGAGSDFSGLFHAWTADPMSQTRHTLRHINQAPMFHPLSETAQFPTGSSGVIPTGTYYAHVGGGKRPITERQRAALAAGRAKRRANLAAQKGGYF